MAYITYEDDGTNISMKAGTITILKYRKSDGQILFDGDINTNAY